MEGPTPVSALIHAATMVTAGIFLMIRCSHLIDLSETVLKLMVVFGVLTSVFSGLVALGQWDLKKIIAFSTCSQLGYMFSICGLSSYSLSFFHLTTHAFFKALLFLTAGYIIHMCSGEQDIRKMGSIVRLSPFAYIMMLLASLSLMGFLGFSGFYSKEALVHVFYVKSGFNQVF
jgi:NADH-quinone oxidoreductase subunit L